MAFKMRGMDKFYGDRSRREIRQDIREERRSLKDHGGSREEVKEYNKYQRKRKREIRADVLDQRAKQPIAQGADTYDKRGDKKARKTSK